jgi:hypothetical protein
VPVPVDEPEPGPVDEPDEPDEPEPAEEPEPVDVPDEPDAPEPLELPEVDEELPPRVPPVGPLGDPDPELDLTLVL